MGCNAWNHPANCDCGWGGDTGGGGWQYTPLPNYASPATPRLTMGHEWVGNFAPIFNSFVDPNAKCPVCGDPVFFYQSPNGGRVFFDELGPPWPKHPCTDNAFRASESLEVEALPLLPGRLDPDQSVMPNQWQPLLHKGWKEVGDHDVFRVDPKQFGFAGKEIVLSAILFRDRPLFWRVNMIDPTLLDISSFEVDADHTIEERVETVNSWSVDFANVGSRKVTEPMALPTLYALACWISFYWEGKVEDWDKRPWIDLKLARQLFDRASNAGHANSKIALGRIYQKGLGMPVHPSAAFRLFNEAAELRDGERAMHFIAECYRKGIGVQRDEGKAKDWKQRHMKAMQKKQTAVTRMPYRG